MDGGTLVDLLESRVVQMAAIIAALIYLYRAVVKPVVNACKLLADRWEDITAVADLRVEVASIKEDLRPSNGDQRTISDRLDEIKHSVRENAVEMTGLRDQQQATTVQVADLAIEHDYNFGELERWAGQFKSFHPPRFKSYTRLAQLISSEPMDDDDDSRSS